MPFSTSFHTAATHRARALTSAQPAPCLREWQLSDLPGLTADKVFHSTAEIKSALSLAVCETQPQTQTRQVYDLRGGVVQQLLGFTSLQCFSHITSYRLVP